MTHDELIEVVKANRDGQPIEWYNALTQKWLLWEHTDAADLLSALGARAKLRVKPEPRRLWIPDVMAYTTRDGAARAFPDANILEVVEVVQ